MAKRQRKRRKPTKPMTVKPGEELVGKVGDRRTVWLPAGIEWEVKKKASGA